MDIMSVTLHDIPAMINMRINKLYDGRVDKKLVEINNNVY